MSDETHLPATFPDPVVDPLPGQVTTEEAVRLGDAAGAKLLEAMSKKNRPKFMADTVPVFVRVAQVRARNGVVQFAPVTPFRDRHGEPIWLTVTHRVMDRCGFFLTGVFHGPSTCVHPLVTGTPLMARFTKNKIVLDMRLATPEETAAAPARDGGGRE